MGLLIGRYSWDYNALLDSSGYTHDPDRVFTSLCHYMDVTFLEEAYWRLKRTSVPGLSGTTFKNYGKQLEENLQALRAFEGGEL